MSAKVEQQPADWRRFEGLAFGGLGVLCFSVTLPATRAAVPDLGSTTVGLGRALVAATLAAILLLAHREQLPPRKYWSGLAVVAFGLLGFSLFSAFALQSVPAAHGAVVTGLLPAATAVMAVFRVGERPPRIFWLGVVLGVVAVLVFALAEGAGSLQAGDILMLIAVVLGALGYAEGGRISRELGGWRVICWALLFAAPFLVVPVALAVVGHNFPPIHTEAWLGFAYVSTVSMFLGFFAWYRGLALGGVARVGQLQLLQPVLTILWAALLIGEPLKLQTILASLLVVASVAFVQWAARRKG